MTKVFIGGSRKISRLSPDVQGRLERIVERALPVVIGDANGADKAVQGYLDLRAYGSVEVFCSGESPRNNVGGWPIHAVHPGHSRKDFDYYATKDREMALQATVGLMLWDGESRGTLLNILRSWPSRSSSWSTSRRRRRSPRCGLGRSSTCWQASLIALAPCDSRSRH